MSRSGTSQSSTVVVRAWACSTWCLGTGRTYVPLMPKEATRSYRHACNVKLLHRALKCRDYKKKKKQQALLTLEASWSAFHTNVFGLCHYCTVAVLRGPTNVRTREAFYFGTTYCTPLFPLLSSRTFFLSLLLLQCRLERCYLPI